MEKFQYLNGKKNLEHFHLCRTKYKFSMKKSIKVTWK